MSDIVNWIILALAVVAFGYMLWRGSQIKDAALSAQEVRNVAEMAALAAEEFGRKGHLTTSDAKLRYAIKVFRRWVPTGKLSDQDMLDAIHSAVPLVNSLRPGTIVIEEETDTSTQPPFPEIGIQKPV